MSRHSESVALILREPWYRTATGRWRKRALLSKARDGTALLEAAAALGGTPARAASLVGTNTSAYLRALRIRGLTWEDVRDVALGSIHARAYVPPHCVTRVGTEWSKVGSRVFDI